MDVPEIMGEDAAPPVRPVKINRFPVVRPVLWMAAGSILTILILAIVAATFLVGGTSIREQAVMKSLSTSLMDYHKEYGRFPLQKDVQRAETDSIPMQGAVLSALLARDNQLNPRQIVFYHPPSAKEGKAGLTQSDDLSYKMVDANGNVYFVVVDQDGDGFTPNPNAGDTRRKQLHASVLVYSAGPDENPHTWEDNTVSW